MTARERIRDDLRGVFRGRLLFDAPSRAVVAADAGPFEETPHGLAEPLDAPDLAVLVQYAHQNALPIVPRGAGTSPAGSAIGRGLIVDLSVHFRSIIDTGPDWVRVQAGVTVEELAVVLAGHGRRFPVESPTTGARTIGGMVATDAAGGNAVRAGYCRDHVRAAGVVFDSGESAVVLAAGAKAESFGLPAPERGPRFIELRAQSAAILAEHRELIQLTRPLTRFDRCGYNLSGGLTAAGLDLVQLLVGSEGTLGLLTEFVLATEPLPGGAADGVLGFPTLDAALRAGLAMRAVEGLSRCELLDQRLVALARPHADGIGPVPAEVGAVLVVTVEADSPDAAVDRLRAAVRRARDAGGSVLLAGPVGSAEGRARVARFRSAATGPLAARDAGPRLVTGVEDIAVPAEELPRFLPQVRAVLRHFGVSAAVRVQVLSGMVQVRPLLDLSDAHDRQTFWPLAEALHGRALAVGGTVSASHATGIARTPWVENQFGPLMPVFAELKRAYDPRNILNPGKGITPDPSRPAWPLKPPVTGPGLVPLLTWSSAELSAQVANCNGCGDCRSRTVGRMCPTFHATGTESASPRAKAFLVRAAMAAPADGADPVRLSSDEARAVAAACVHCKMCPRECGAKVDVPRLALEVKAAHHAEHGLDRTDWVLARIETFAWLLSKASLTSNTLLRLRSARWVAEKLFGVSRRRVMPRITHHTYLRRAWLQGLNRRTPEGANPGTPRVAYFVDHFANFHDPTIGTATVAVLKHNGVDVCVPWRQRACGLAPLVQGDIETAREIAAYNVRTFANLVRDGYTVVCSEPTAAVTLSQDYLALLDSPDARLVAANTVELSHYLGGMHARGALKTEFQRLDVNLGHHVPCHVKALGHPPTGPDLLRLIPGVQAYTIDAGCSGMAGTWGLRADSYDASRAAGAGLFAELAKPRVIYGSTECGPCRMQMHDAGRKRTLHPVQYLALAYGLMPEMRGRLARPVGRRVD